MEDDLKMIAAETTTTTTTATTKNTFDLFVCKGEWSHTFYEAKAFISKLRSLSFDRI